MPNSPSIGRSSSTLPLSDSNAPSSSSPADGGKPAGGLPHAGPQADDKLGALAGNGSGAAAGKGARASFAAKVPSPATSTTTAPGAAQSAAQSAAGGAPGRAGRLGAFSQGAATLANGATGVATVGVNVVGGLLQLEQAAVMQLAELLKQGARNVEEASKG
ncbi:hypothetical protein [Paraburkholderia sp. RL17-373-BIF-A]|uniref:hypothetical protein n=1 Tax=Paraburkholderia sp. RL17-373-BIF-A TaxID=3031629 RepID=UPI0038B6CF2C